MQKLKVAAVSMNNLSGQTAKNLKSIEQWSVQAKEAGAELVLFPAPTSLITQEVVWSLIL